MSTTLTFTLPEDRIAGAPAERRGLARDQVRLMVLDRIIGQTTHTRFDHLSEFLRPGDLLVFNSSRTLPAVLQGCDDDHQVCAEVRLAQHHSDGSWQALIISHPRSVESPKSGMSLHLGDDLTAKLLEPSRGVPRMWNLRLSHDGPELLDRLHRFGQPIRYEHVAAPWPLEDYQTVFAQQPGSAEMPSAGRAFTWRMLFDLCRQGIGTASLVLHTGLSSYMDDAVDASHPIAEEEYRVSAETAARVNQTKERGGRVIAVGTTVVRALESVAEIAGWVRPGHGAARLRIAPDYDLWAVDGLLTGLHEPEASHLDLLSAFAPAEMIHVAYEEAIERGYLWHEFGDLNLIL